MIWTFVFPSIPIWLVLHELITSMKRHNTGSVHDLRTTFQRFHLASRVTKLLMKIAFLQPSLAQSSGGMNKKASAHLNAKNCRTFLLSVSEKASLVADSFTALR